MLRIKSYDGTALIQLYHCCQSCLTLTANSQPLLNESVMRVKKEEVAASVVPISLQCQSSDDQILIFLLMNNYSGVVQRLMELFHTLLHIDPVISATPGSLWLLMHGNVVNY